MSRTPLAMRVVAAATLCIASSSAIVGPAATTVQAATVNRMFLISDHNPVLNATYAGTAVKVTGTASKVTITGSSAAGTDVVHLVMPTGKHVAVGVYENIGPIVLPSTKVHFDATFGSVKCLSTSVGRLLVDQVVFTNNLVTKFVARWEYHCNGGTSAEFGGVSFNGTVPFRVGGVGSSPLRFPAYRLGDTSASSIVDVTNAGPSPLNVGVIKFTGTNANEFVLTANPCTGHAIAAGAKCTVRVAYHPTHAVGNHTASLTIFDDVSPAGGGGTGFRVALSGTAIAGYAGLFTPLPLTRVVDTRKGLGAPLLQLGAGSTVSIPLLGKGGIPTTGVRAVVVDLIALNATAASSITAWAAGTTRPGTTAVTTAVRINRSAQVTVTLGTGGAVNIFNQLGSVDVVLDVEGYYSTTTGRRGSAFHAVPTTTVFDGSTPDGAAASTLAAGGLINSSGELPVPTTATAVVVSLSALNATAAGSLAVSTTALSPTTPGLVFGLGDTTSLVTLPYRLGATLAIRNLSSAPVAIALDIVGFYDGNIAPTEGRYVPVTPIRLYDTSTSTGAIGDGSSQRFTIAGHGGVPLTAKGVVASLTASQPTHAGFISVLTEAVPWISTRTSSFASGATVTAAALAALEISPTCMQTCGAIDVHAVHADVQTVVDVTGYFTS